MNLLDELHDANEELKILNLHATIFVVGGAGLKLLNIGFRETFDIDGLIKAENDLPIVKAILNKYSINDDMKHVAFIPTPDDFTFGECLSLSHLTVYVASLEDIALMKLFTTRPKDYDDLINYVLPHIKDKTKLFERAKSYESSYPGNVESTHYWFLK